LLDDRGVDVLECCSRRCLEVQHRTNGETAMMHGIFWYALIGWVSGWVTGRAMKGSNHGAFGDALLGLLGGLGGGWLMRNTYVQSNWGFLVSAIVAATAASLLTWSLRRLSGVWIHRQHA
jgi:uncharacterized membrane protein YeaQ/YmgE (transglycosylase-associated protein family)